MVDCRTVDLGLESRLWAWLVKIRRSRLRGFGRFGGGGGEESASGRLYCVSEHEGRIALIKARTCSLVDR